jgi:hypothetical protein
MSKALRGLEIWQTKKKEHRSGFSPPSIVLRFQGKRPGGPGQVGRGVSKSCTSKPQPSHREGISLSLQIFGLLLIIIGLVNVAFPKFLWRERAKGFVILDPDAPSGPVFMRFLGVAFVASGIWIVIVARRI